MTQVAITYGQALYSLASQEGQSEELQQQLEVLSQVFSQEPDFLRLLSSPELTKQERCQILDDSFRDKVAPYVLNFMKILTEKGYIRQFPGCCQAYREQYNRDHGILPVQVVSAVALTQAQQQKLSQKLCAITGKAVMLSCTVDPQVLGGIRLSYDGKQVDGTVQGRLADLGKLLKNTVL